MLSIEYNDYGYKLAKQSLEWVPLTESETVFDAAQRMISYFHMPKSYTSLPSDYHVFQAFRYPNIRENMLQGFPEFRPAWELIQRVGIQAAYDVLQVAAWVMYGAAAGAFSYSDRYRAEREGWKDIRAQLLKSSWKEWQAERSMNAI